MAGRNWLPGEVWLKHLLTDGLLCQGQPELTRLQCHSIVRVLQTRHILMVYTLVLNQNLHLGNDIFPSEQCCGSKILISDQAPTLPLITAPDPGILLNIHFLNLTSPFFGLKKLLTFLEIHF